MNSFYSRISGLKSLFSVFVLLKLSGVLREYSFLTYHTDSKDLTFFYIVEPLVSGTSYLIYLKLYPYLNFILKYSFVVFILALLFAGIQITIVSFLILLVLSVFYEKHIMFNLSVKSNWFILSASQIILAIMFFLFSSDLLVYIYLLSMVITLFIQHLTIKKLKVNKTVEIRQNISILISLRSLAVSYFRSSVLTSSLNNYILLIFKIAQQLAIFFSGKIIEDKTNQKLDKGYPLVQAFLISIGLILIFSQNYSIALPVLLFVVILEIRLLKSLVK